MEYVYPLARADVIELMRAKGVNPTQQRIEIAQTLFAKPQHLSADQVMNLVNKQRPLVSKATVYNTLGLFARKGLVREVIVDPAKVFYDPTTDPHYHFYNVDSGELTDVDPERISLMRLPDLPEGTETAGVDVVIRIRNRTSRH